MYNVVYKYMPFSGFRGSPGAPLLGPVQQVKTRSPVELGGRPDALNRPFRTGSSTSWPRTWHSSLALKSPARYSDGKVFNRRGEPGGRQWVATRFKRGTPPLLGWSHHVLPLGEPFSGERDFSVIAPLRCVVDDVAHGGAPTAMAISWAYLSRAAEDSAAGP